MSVPLSRGKHYVPLLSDHDRRSEWRLIRRIAFDLDLTEIVSAGPLTGGSVSCSEENRYPRKIFTQLPGGKPAERCACMEGTGWTDVRQVLGGAAEDRSGLCGEASHSQCLRPHLMASLDGLT